MRLGALLGVVVTLLAAPAVASTPKLTERVTDDAHLLTEPVIATLAGTLAAIESDTGAQVVVYTTPSLNGQDIESFSNAVFRETGIGQKNEDNGVLLVIARAERKVRIEVGRRLEPTLTDAAAKLIIVNDMKPYLHKGGTDDWDSAVSHAVASIEQYVRADYAERQTTRPAAQAAPSASGAVLVLLIAFIVIAALVVGLVATIADRSRRRRDTQSYDFDEEFPRREYVPPRSYPSRRDSAYTTGAAVGAASDYSSRRRRTNDGDSGSRSSGWDTDNSRSSDSDNTFSGGGGDSGGGGASGDV